ncbi:hypothetical protein LMH87_010136 [Akanthomyces muscarius]|uniref:Wax synthase domain-containing protein n=1 Tax=Akanthomyces muscarius TaxID=2231603 RepID=A0A9W8UMX2_AKAMU|nr:hypothetical protein LMH87_010136 [Akanthomyces muscarius]KAJ4153656.1 hypothetical protein LMH87_010136 [Akanthomyces muscarius]
MHNSTMTTAHPSPPMAFEIPKSLVTWDVRSPIIFAAQSIITAALICTTRKSSLLRPAVLPVLVWLMFRSWEAAPAFTGQGVLYSFWWVGPYANIFHCMNQLCLYPLDSADIKHEMGLQATRENAEKANGHTEKTSPGLFSQLWFTTAMLFSFRGIGTTHQISYIPAFPSGVVPSRIRFLTRQCFMILIQYLIMDVLASSPPPPDVVDSWAEGKEWLWISSLNKHAVTAADLQNRFVGCAMNWFIVGRVMNDIWYRIFSVIFVGLGISKPGQWPPCYGNYNDTCSLRGYFGKFWHQTVRWPFQGASSYFTRRILRLPQGVIERYANITVVFFLSGTLHSILDIAFGGQYDPAGSLLCFGLLLPLGIIFEDTAQWAWRRATGVRTGLFGRVVGHLWVALYLALVTPIFNYRLQRIPGNPTYLVPWSVISLMKETFESMAGK